jgi:CheY-like chemotaxis protein
VELHDIEPSNGVGSDSSAVTEQRVEQLDAAGPTALRANLHQDEYLRVLAHRLRNPLAPIRTCIQILENRAPQDRLLHQALDLMDRQLRRLSNLLDDLCSIHGPASGAPMPETPRAQVNAAEVGSPLNLKHRVLIVDDNLDAAEALRLLLCIKGFEAFTAADGIEAIERTQERSPDIIFMDLEMPNMDGWEAARRIHAMPECEAIPIVALTGLDRDSDRERSRESGMVEHLVKPVEMAAVQDLMQSLVPLGPAYRRLRM